MVSALLDDERGATMAREVADEQERLREVHEGRATRALLAYEDARERRLRTDWTAQRLPTPEFTGRRVLEDVPLEELIPYIDWTFFFTAWELKGKFPEVLDHPRYGEAARELHANATKMLEELVAGGRLTARAVYGFWPAHADGDDIVLFEDEARTIEVARFPMLRQQRERPDGKPQLSLADYVAPADAGVPDHVGAFAVTAGIGAEEIAREREAAHDDYESIMVKALADRLAEAFAEMLHQRARREWGYGADEMLSNEQLIAEEYRGIRPAFGYPACPDHLPKRALFDLLGAREIGMELSESMAMLPAASVSGIYLSHPESQYFAIGRIDADQVADYAERMGLSVEEVERWLAPSLGYEPATVRA